MWDRAYRATLEPDAGTPWSRMTPSRRKQLVSALWLATELLLLIGLFERRAYEAVVVLSLAHAALLVGLVGSPYVFPAQLRIAYFAWVAVGTYVPGMTILMYITTVGVFTNLAFGYCPLARLLYLLPFNRDHALTWRLAWRAQLQRPTVGRFHLDPAQIEAEGLSDGTVQ